MTEKLKHCPFCGGEAVVEPEGFVTCGFWVTCLSCGIRQGNSFMTEDEAVEAWNRRVES